MFIAPAYREFLENGHAYQEVDIHVYQAMHESVLETNHGFTQIMDACNGEPLGFEFKKRSADAWSFIVQEMSFPESGEYRIQMFDRGGFFSHETTRTIEEAVEQMANAGYTEFQPGTLDALSRKSHWKQGMEINAIVQSSNAKLLGWDHALQLIGDIRRKYADSSEI